MGKKRFILDGSQSEELFIELKILSPKETIESLAIFLENNDIELKYIFDDAGDRNHAWYVLGCAFENVGEFNIAATCFLTAIEIWPDDADAYLAYSNNSQDNTDVIEQLSEVTKRIHDNRLLFNLSNSYLEEERFNDAREALEKIDLDWDQYSLVLESLKRLSDMKGSS